MMTRKLALFRSVAREQPYSLIIVVTDVCDHITDLEMSNTMSFFFSHLSSIFLN